MPDATDARPLTHAPTCSRPAPILRLSWAGRPEQACRECGRYAPAGDQRPTRQENPC